MKIVCVCMFLVAAVAGQTFDPFGNQQPPNDPNLVNLQSSFSTQLQNQNQNQNMLNTNVIVASNPNFPQNPNQNFLDPNNPNMMNPNNPNMMNPNNPNMMNPNNQNTMDPNNQNTMDPNNPNMMNPTDPNTMNPQMNDPNRGDATVQNQDQNQAIQFAQPQGSILQSLAMQQQHQQRRPNPMQQLIYMLLFSEMF